MKATTKRKLGDFTVTILFVALLGWAVLSIGSCMAKDLKSPTQAELDAKWARSVAAKKEGLKEIAKNVQAGENTAFIPMSPYSHWFGDMEGTYYVDAEDITTIVDHFCKIHNVHMTSPPVPVNSGYEGDLIGFSIIYEPN